MLAADALVALTPLVGSLECRRQFEQPAGAPYQRLDILECVQVGNETGIAGFVGAHEFGFALDQVPAGQVRRAREYLRPRKLVEQNGVASLAIDDRHHNVAPDALLEGPDELGQIARTDQRLVGRHDEHRVEAAAQRFEPCAHRALLALRVSLIVRERYREALNLPLDRRARVAGDDDDLVDPRTAERDELPADQRDTPKPNQRLRDAAHPSAFAR